MFKVNNWNTRKRCEICSKLSIKSHTWEEGGPKTPGDIITLHMCTINDNHMIYGSSDMEYDRQNFLSFWTIFCPFMPLETWKIKIKTNEKKYWRKSFYTSVHKIMIIYYTVPEIRHVTDLIFIFHLGLFFALLPP